MSLKYKQNGNLIDIAGQGTGGSGGSSIDDSTIAYNKTWSSHKIDESIPKDTNDLTNGAGFITASGTAKTISDTLPISKGGTGATTQANARTNLGLGGASTYGATTSVTSGSTSLVTSGAVYSALSGYSTNGTLKGPTTSWNTAVSGATTEIIALGWVDTPTRLVWTISIPKLALDTTARWYVTGHYMNSGDNSGFGLQVTSTTLSATNCYVNNRAVSASTHFYYR